MSKLLLLFLVGVALYLIFARSGRSSARKNPAPAPAPDGKMIRCKQCGLHFPAEEGVVADGNSYCCDEHRRLGQG